MRPKLAFVHDHGFTTFVALNDAAEDRRLEVSLPDGRILGIEFRLCAKSRSHLAVTITMGKRSSSTSLTARKKTS